MIFEKTIKKTTGCRLLSLALSVFGETPISIEDVASKHNEVKLDVGLDYISSESNHLLANHSIALTHSNGSITYIPIDIQYATQKTDSLLGNIGLKYGITPKTELYARTSGLWQKTYTDSTNQSSKSLTQLNDFVLGTQHKIIEEGKNPALLGFLEAVVFEKGLGGHQVGKSYVLGLRTYKVSDPVVFALSGAYRINFKSHGVKAGNSLSLSPSIAFAANNRVTLNAGVNWQLQQAEQMDEKLKIPHKTAISLTFGSNYAINENTNINTQIKTSLTGDKQTTLSFLISHKFGGRLVSKPLNDKPKVEPIN